jgi:REP element-mobilizing transposase RayT
MPDHCGNQVEGGRYFFTVYLQDRRSDLLVTESEARRSAVRARQARRPFYLDAWWCCLTRCTACGRYLQTTTIVPHGGR